MVPTAAVPALDSGSRVTTLLSIAVLEKPVVVTETRPFAVVLMPFTYFVTPDPPGEISQPHPLMTAEALVPLW